MSSLTLRYLPEIIEKAKDQDTDRQSVNGSAVAETNFVRAVLSYGSYDRYYFLWDLQESLEQGKVRLSEYPNPERAELVLLEDYDKLKAIDRMAMFIGDSQLSKLAHLRNARGRAIWPVTALTFTLSHTRSLPEIIQALLGDIYHYDSLICLSQAGKKVMENILSKVCESITQRLNVPLSVKPGLPVIPLGIEASVFHPRDKIAARSRFDIPADHTVFLYLGRFSVHFKMDLFPLILCFA